MKQQPVRPAHAGLLVAMAGLGLVFARGAAPDPPSTTDETSLEDELERVRLEQDLMLAERTALMLDDFGEALESWEGEAEEAGEGR